MSLPTTHSFRRAREKPELLVFFSRWFLSTFDTWFAEKWWSCCCCCSMPMLNKIRFLSVHFGMVYKIEDKRRRKKERSNRVRMIGRKHCLSHEKHPFGLWNHKNLQYTRMLLNFIKFVFMMRIKIKFIHKRASSLHSLKICNRNSEYGCLVLLFLCRFLWPFVRSERGWKCKNWHTHTLSLTSLCYIHSSTVRSHTTFLHNKRRNLNEIKMFSNKYVIYKSKSWLRCNTTRPRYFISFKQQMQVSERNANTLFAKNIPL